MQTEPGDLTAAARIRHAALEGFAVDGVAGTSIRDVARRAGVSPGLVQYHFKNKDGLRAAVDQYVTRIGTNALAATETTAPDVVGSIGDRITAWMRDHPLTLLYAARSAAEGDASGLAILDSLVAAGDAHIERLAALGLLREDLDLRWGVLQVIVLNLGTALFESAIDRYLDAPLHSPDQLQRWNRAGTDLFRFGFFRPEGSSRTRQDQPAPSHRPARQAGRK